MLVLPASGDGSRLLPTRAARSKGHASNEPRRNAGDFRRRVYELSIDFTHRLPPARQHNWNPSNG